MSHEMIRHEAEEAGFDTEGLTIAVAGDTREEDVVNVWPLLGNAEEVEPGAPDEYGPVGEDEPTDEEVDELTRAVEEDPDLPEAAPEPREYSDGGVS